MAVKFLQGLWYNPPSERNGLYQNCAGKSTNIFAMLTGENSVVSPSHPISVASVGTTAVPARTDLSRKGRGGREEVDRPILI